jgi:hypothetical protein
MAGKKLSPQFLFRSSRSRISRRKFTFRRKFSFRRNRAGIAFNAAGPAALPAALLAVLILPALFLAGPAFAETMPDLGGFDRGVFEYHLGRADRELSPGLWMDEARRGIDLARNAWERAALELYQDPLLRREAEGRILQWSEEELEARFSRWLLRRFFGNGQEIFAGRLSGEIEEAVLRYTYHLDEGGNILYDENSGDPLLVRPGEEGRDFSADREQWRGQIEDAIQRETEAYGEKLAALFPELLRYIPGENRAGFERILEAQSLAAVSGLRREFEGILDREERLFTARRLGDVWSLRRKSEDETAEIISARIISDAETACDEGIAGLAARIEAAETGGGDLALAGAAWLEAYREQFERGLKTWEAAEERFFVRRLEWEQDAGTNYLEGENAWAAAFDKLERERQDWELKAKALFDSGEAVFQKASETLELAIAEARAEFNRDVQLRITAGADRARAWVDVYVTSGSVAMSAQENIQFWLKNYRGENVPPLAGNGMLFDQWIAGEIKNHWKAMRDNYEERPDYRADRLSLEEAEALALTTSIYWENRRALLGKQKEDLEKEIAGILQRLNASDEDAPDYLTRQALQRALENCGAEMAGLQRGIDQALLWVTNYAAMHHEALIRREEQSRLFAERHRLYFEIEKAALGIISGPEEEGLFRQAAEAGITISARFDAAREMRKWAELYHAYIDKAMAARDALANDFALVMGNGALADILDEGLSSEDFNLDEYQLELIRVKAAAGYWEKRTIIAREVYAYAEAAGAGRMTDGEGFKAWTEAKQSYDAALAGYEAAQVRFAEAGAGVAETQAALNGAASALRLANEKLEELNRGYGILAAAAAAQRGDFIMEELAQKYTELLREHGLLSGTDSGTVYARYLERAHAWGIALELERSGEFLRGLVTGDGEGEKSLALLAESAAAILVLAPGDQAPDDTAAYGLAEDSPYLETIRELLARRDRLLAAENDPARAAGIRENYEALIGALTGAAKETAERELALRLAALRLLISGSAEDWYFSVYAYDAAKAASLSLKGLEGQLQHDADMNRRALLAARVELELETLKRYRGGNPDRADAEFLAGLCPPDMAGVEEAIAALEELRELHAALEGSAAGDYVRALEDLAGKNARARNFIRRESFLGILPGSTLAESFLAAESAASERSEALLALYCSLGSRTAPGRRDAEDRAVRALRDIFAACHIPLDNGAILPGMQSVGAALAGTDPGKNTAVFLTMIDEQLEELPPWLADEFETWKASLIEYMAVRTVHADAAVSGNIAGLEAETRALEIREQILLEIYALLDSADGGSVRALASALAAGAGGVPALDFSPGDRALLETELARRMGRDLAELSGAPDTADLERLRRDLSNSAAHYYGYVGESLREQGVEEALWILRLRDTLEGVLDPSLMGTYEREAWNVRRYIEFGIGGGDAAPILGNLQTMTAGINDPAVRSILFLLEELPALVREGIGMEEFRGILYGISPGGEETGTAVTDILDRLFAAGPDSPGRMVSMLEEELAARLEALSLFIAALRAGSPDLAPIAERMAALLIAARTDRPSRAGVLLDILDLRPGSTAEELYARSRAEDFDGPREAVFFDHPLVLETILFRLKYAAYSGGEQEYRDERERCENFILAQYGEDPALLARGQAALEAAESFARAATLFRSYLGTGISGDRGGWVKSRDLSGETDLTLSLLTGVWRDPFVAAIEWGGPSPEEDALWRETVTRELNGRYQALIREGRCLRYEYAFLLRQGAAVQTFEEMRTAEGRHWRQFITEEFLSDYNGDAAAGPGLSPGVMTSPEAAYKIVKAAANREDGVLADAFDRTERDAARINAAFAAYTGETAADRAGAFEERARLYLNNPLAAWDETLRETGSQALYDAYSREAGELLRHTAYEEFLRREIEQLGGGYEVARRGTEAVKEEMFRRSNEIKAQELIYEQAAAAYSRAAGIFQAAGGAYDLVYGDIKKLYATVEDARFAYEIEEAIRKWASTAYIGSGDLQAVSEVPWQSPYDEMVYSRARLDRANIALDALTGLYNNGEDRRPYDNPEYEKIYREYEESFSRLFLSRKALNSLEEGIKKATEANDARYLAYKNQLNLFGKVLDMDAAYQSPEDQKLWGINDMIRVSEGKLQFSRDENFALQGLTAEKAGTLENYFSAGSDAAGETYRVSSFENSLRELSAWFESYGLDREKYRQFGLARDYLVRQLIRHNPEIKQLADRYRIAAPLRSGQNLGRLPIRDNGLWSDTLVHEEASDFQGPLYGMQERAWNNLDSEARANLEFYIILTLTGGGGNNAGAFSRISELEEYRRIRSLAVDRYDYLRWKASTPIIGFIWNGARNKLRATKNAVEAPYEELVKQMEAGLNGLTQNTEGIKDSLQSYRESSARLILLKGEKPETETLSWAGIEAALREAGDMDDAEIARLKLYWDQMIARNGTSAGNNSEALSALVQWSGQVNDDTRRELESRWAADEQLRAAGERRYRETFDAYVNGRASLGELNEAAAAAYGSGAAAWKNHAEKLERVIMANLGGVAESGPGYGAEYTALAGEYAGIIDRAYALRYGAELAAREAEWNQQRKDIEEKRKTWKETAGMILARGRTGWKEGLENLRGAGSRWARRYEEEYRRAADAWTAAYLAGLEDKEAWVIRATDAANRAASGAMLALVGAEAEAGARAWDTRDPAGLNPSGAREEAGALLDGLLGSAGIVNMSGALAAAGGSAGTVSTLVRRGMGGPAVWNTGLVRVEAAKLARETNAALAARESVRIAAHAQKIMEEAVAELRTTVEEANAGFRDSMDNTFIVEGQWRRSGKNYIKDVIVHSTFFDPVITESASVEGYRDYRMEPVNIVTDLSESRLRNLNASGIQALINNMYKEVRTVFEDIFGDAAGGTAEGIAARTVSVGITRKKWRPLSLEYTYTDEEGGEVQAFLDTGEFYDEYEHLEDRVFGPGKFGVHLGYHPVIKPGANANDGRNKIFQNPGAGQLGRLMADYYYWSMREGQGIRLVTAAQWDKPLWDSRGSFFAAPSLRSVADIGMTVAALALAPASGGMSLAAAAALNLADDALFGSLDVAGGFKGIDEAGFEFGKKALITAANSGIGAVFTGVQAGEGAVQGFFGSGGLSGMALGKAGGGINQVISGAAMTGLRGTVTTTVNSALGAVSYDREAGFGFSRDAFTSGFRTGAIGMAGSVSSSLTGGILGLGNTGFTGSLFKDGTTLANLAGGIAGEGIRYALGGEASFNLLNLKGLGIDTGLLEMRLGREGMNMGLGTGGLDISPGTLAGAVRGLEAWKVNLELAASNNSNSRTYAGAMRTLYTGSDVNREEYGAILSGKTVIEERRNTAETQSIYDEMTGIKTVFLGENALNDGSAFGLNVVFSHESYRNGRDNGAEGQIIERDNAVAGHAATASALMDTYGVGSIGAEMALEAGLFNYAENYDPGLLSALLDRYDTSADYWKLKVGADGFHEIVYDGEKRLVVEYLDPEGKVISKVVPANQNVKNMGMAESLAAVLGLDRIGALLGSDLTKPYTYDLQTMREVLDCPDEEVMQMYESGKIPAWVTEKQRLALAGEALMKQSGSQWNGKKWTNMDTVKYTLTDRNLSHEGRIMALINPQGGFDYSTVKATVWREGLSYLGWSRHEGEEKFNEAYQGLDAITITSYNLNGSVRDSREFGGFHTVDNMTKNKAGANFNQPYNDPVLGNIQGNTIAPGRFGITFFGTSNFYGEVGGVENAVLVINNATTISGVKINSFGYGGSDKLRWLAHALRAEKKAGDFDSYYSDGCFVAFPSVMNPMLSYLASTGMQQGYQIDARLYESWYYPSSSAPHGN